MTLRRVALQLTRTIARPSKWTWYIGAHSDMPREATNIEAPMQMYFLENEDGTVDLSCKMPIFILSAYRNEDGELLAAIGAGIDAIFEAIDTATVHADQALGSKARRWLLRF